MTTSSVTWRWRKKYSASERETYWNGQSSDGSTAVIWQYDGGGSYHTENAGNHLHLERAKRAVEEWHRRQG